MSSTGPKTGILAKADLVRAAPVRPPRSEGFSMISLTSTRPVRAQITTVSQNVPVADTSACLIGLRVCAAAATMGADPSPDSLEKSPRAIP